MKLLRKSFVASKCQHKIWNLQENTNPSFNQWSVKEIEMNEKSDSKNIGFNVDIFGEINPSVMNNFAI